MNIVLYRNLSEANVVDKQLSAPVEFSGYFRDSTSVTNPTIIVETEQAIVWHNYLYIKDWNRYYFIESIEVVRTGLWAISAHVDVLMTYRDTIRQQSGIIARQENLYNLYLDDNKFLVNAPRMVVTKAFPNRIQPGNTTGAMSFILTLAGGAESETTT